MVCLLCSPSQSALLNLAQSSKLAYSCHEGSVGQSVRWQLSGGGARRLGITGLASSQVKVLLSSEARKPYAEAAGHGRRGWCARVWSSPPLGLSKESSER